MRRLLAVPGSRLTPCEPPASHGIDDDPFVAYCYSYPHKTAYRPLTPPVALEDVWRGEDRTRLFLYLHVPFCLARCGFCNLFTLAAPDDTVGSRYLSQLSIQSQTVYDALGGPRFVRVAVGGGTPTLLAPRQLHSLFDIVERTLKVDTAAVPLSFEVSAASATDDKLRLLRDRGTTRLSVGVQSFEPREAAALGRRQTPGQVARALETAREVGFPTLNIDLIYGIPGQSEESWLRSIEAALRFEPEELYLYPLYVRPLTALDGQCNAAPLHPLTAYRLGRERLLAAGYDQLSLRMFRRRAAPEDVGPVYCCQSDGMVGLGCGARSYTRARHYGSRYAVGRQAIAAILDDYLALPAAAFRHAVHGVVLDADDQRRRYVILTLLQTAGVDRRLYRDRFHTDVLADFPELAAFAQEGWLSLSPTAVQLTATGLERSDALGPALWSARVRRLMEEHVCQ